jgi:hypothetical protein
MPLAKRLPRGEERERQSRGETEKKDGASAPISLFPAEDAPPSEEKSYFARSREILGKTSGGATSSFAVGPISIQPSEFGKFATMLFLAAYLSEDRSTTVQYSKFLGALVLVGAPMALVVIEPDLGSASVYVALAMAVLLVAGAKVRHIMMINSMAVLTVTSAVTPAAPSTTAKPTKLPMSGPVTSLPLLLGGAFLGAAGLWLRRRPI